MRKLLLIPVGLVLVALVLGGETSEAPAAPAAPTLEEAAEPVLTRTTPSLVEGAAEAEGEEALAALLEPDPRLPELSDDSPEAWEARQRTLHDDALADVLAKLEAAGHDPAAFAQVLDVASELRWAEGAVP